MLKLNYLMAICCAANIGVVSAQQNSLKQQGASSFLYGNIQTLLNTTCGRYPATC